MKTENLKSLCHGVLGGAVTVLVCQSGPAIAQVSGSVASFLKLQATSPGTAQTGHANVTGTVVAGHFQGEGSGVTGLNADNLTSGTVPSDRISVGGDLTGPLAASSITKLQGTPVSAQSPLQDTVLGFNGTNWAARLDSLTLPYTRTHQGNIAFAVTNSGDSIRGTSIGGCGLVGISGSMSLLVRNDGVLGQTTQDYAIHGYATSSALGAGYFEKASHYVLLGGSLETARTNGFYYRDYTASTTSAAVPVAYGTVNAAGTIAGGTGNFTVTKSATGTYNVQVTGETYSNSNFVVTVTPVSSAPRMFGVVNPGGGPALLRFWDPAGTLTDTQFQFTIWTDDPSEAG